MIDDLLYNNRRSLLILVTDFKINNIFLTFLSLDNTKNKKTTQNVVNLIL
jgi:hypothetical protein